MIELEKSGKSCETPACIEKSYQMSRFMDLTADPCDNFYQYSCGKYDVNYEISAGKASHTAFSVAAENVDKLLKNELSSNKKSSSKAINQARYVYNACLNETQIEEAGVKPLFDEIIIPAFNGVEAFTVGSKYDDQQFNLTDMLIKAFQFGNVSPLFGFTVAASYSNASKIVIYVAQDSVTSPVENYKLRDESPYKEQFAATRKYMIDSLALVFGKKIDEQRIDEMLSIEIELAKISDNLMASRDIAKQNNPMTLEDLEKRVPSIEWRAIIGAPLIRGGAPLKAKGEDLILTNADYFDRIGGVLAKSSKTALYNYIFYKTVKNYFELLGKNFKKLKLDLAKKLTGQTGELERWMECIAGAKLLKFATSRIYVKKAFQEEAKTSAEEMVKGVGIVFREQLETAKWMEETTRKEALKKADLMKNRIGYPKLIASDKSLDEYYEGLDIEEDMTMFTMALNFLKFSSNLLIKKFRKPADKEEWLLPPHEVQAYQDHQRNGIVFTAAIFQAPFFSYGVPKAMNYGSMGMVVGHEITHGFDTSGRRFSWDGNVRDWWDAKTLKTFNEGRDCFVKQYGDYEVMTSAGKQKVNGELTVGENIADNGGLAIAYEAFKRTGDTETILGYDLTPDQLFFVAFAQVWCSKMTPEKLLNYLKTDNHSPPEARVRIPMRNSEEFRKAFKCPKSSAKRCKLW